MTFIFELLQKILVFFVRVWYSEQKIIKDYLRLKR